MGTTVGYVLISYDIDKSHSAVKAELASLGYFDSFKLPKTLKIYHLPNTTLWHKSKSSNQAIGDLKTICKKLNIVIEKVVAVSATEFVGS